MGKREDGVIFQEKHQTGWLPWNKKVYYTYWEVREGQLFQLRSNSLSFVRSMESGK